MNKLLPIILVAALAVGGVSYGVIAMTGNSDSGTDASTEGIDYESVNLMIFGNANNDLTIDSEDKDLIQEIIDGDKDASDYPFADANCDGSIDSDDLDEVQRIIDRTDGMTLHVACYDYANREAVVDVTYPLQNIGLYGMHTITSTLYCNAGSKVVAVANPSGSKAEYPVMMASLAGESISSGMGASAAVDWQKFMEIDTETPISALFVDTAYAGNISATTVKDFERAGIPILSFNGNNVYAQIAASAWIGFLCGSDCEAAGKQFAETSQSVLKTVADKTSGLSDAEKTSFMEFTMWICIYQNDAPANALGELAGGIHYSEVNSEFKSKYEGTSFTMNLDAETLANFQDCGAYLSIRTTDFSSDAKSVVISLYEFQNESMGNIMVTDFMHNAKERLYFVNNLLPSALKVAYIAEILYPSIFGSGFADTYAQEYIDEGYKPFEGQKVEDLMSVFSYSDYQAAGGTH